MAYTTSTVHDISTIAVLCEVTRLFCLFTRVYEGTSYVSCSYLIERMFLELDVKVYSSFDRSGTTGFKYSSLRASLLTVSRFCICHCSA